MIGVLNKIGRSGVIAIYRRDEWDERGKLDGLIVTNVMGLMSVIDAMDYSEFFKKFTLDDN